jgi:hypothetical protein
LFSFSVIFGLISGFFNTGIRRIFGKLNQRPI